MKKDNSLSLLEVTTTDAPESRAVPILSLLEETTPENGGGYHDKPKKATKKPFSPQYRIYCIQNTVGGNADSLFPFEMEMPDRETAEAVFKAFCFEDGVFYNTVQLQVKRTEKGKWHGLETYVLPTEVYVLRTFTGTIDNVHMLSEDRFDDFEQALAAYNSEQQGRHKSHHISLSVYKYRERKCEILATERGFLPMKKPQKAAA